MAKSIWLKFITHIDNHDYRQVDNVKSVKFELGKVRYTNNLCPDVKGIKIKVIFPGNHCCPF